MIPIGTGHRFSLSSPLRELTLPNPLLPALLGAALTLLIGCGGPAQPRRLFSLAPQAPEVVQVTEPPTIRVRELECATSYDQAGLIFRVSAVEIRSFRYATWTAAPGVMMAEVLRRYLSSTGRFIVVDQADQAELELTGRIDVIEQVVENGEWFGRLEMSLALRRVRDRRVFWRGRIDGTEPAAERDVAEVIAAQSRVLSAGLAAALPDITQAAVDATVGPPAGIRE